MTARVLVVDDLEPNVKLLEAKLSAEYFDVVGALNGEEALRVAREEQPDIVLLDVMMPGMDGYEVCRRLKADPDTSHIPVVMVTALDQQQDRIAGLEAGADDFLTKPVEDVALFARVRSLTRLKMMTDELRLRHDTIAAFGLAPDVDAEHAHGEKSRVLVVDDQPDTVGRLKEILEDAYDVAVESEPRGAAARARGGDFDLIVVNMGLETGDALRLCSTIRSMEETRLTPMLTVVLQTETRKLVRALDIGVNDYVTRPIDADELEARVRTQMRRKRFIDELRSSFQMSLELAVTDQLTGLYNRRYLSGHLAAMFERSKTTNRPLALLFIDLDLFKSINDEHGHDVGDEVVREFARRLSRGVRGVDLACRYGGEEFVVAMPDTEKVFALGVAERLREEVAGEPFHLKGENGDVEVTVTVSIGVASTEDGEDDDSPKALLKRADESLFEAKSQGRNRVVDAAA